MYCKFCGAELADDARFCSACGTRLSEIVAEENNANPMFDQNVPEAPEVPAYTYEQTDRAPYEASYEPIDFGAPDDHPNDKGGFLWGLLGCCIPIAGLILFLVWKDSKPKTAKAAGIGALVSVIIGVVYYLIVMAVGIGGAFFG